MRIHSDERRTAYCDLFGDATPGDVNVFVANPDQTTCWHRHQKQTDRFWCLAGSVTFRWFRSGVFHQETLVGGQGAIVTIPPGWWHGYRSGPNGSTVVMFLDQKFNPDDEERATQDELKVAFL